MCQKYTVQGYSSIYILGSKFLDFLVRILGITGPYLALDELGSVPNGPSDLPDDPTNPDFEAFGADTSRKLHFSWLRFFCLFVHINPSFTSYFGLVQPRDPSQKIPHGLNIWIPTKSHQIRRILLILWPFYFFCLTFTRATNECP